MVKKVKYFKVIIS